MADGAGSISFDPSSTDATRAGGVQAQGAPPTGAMQPPKPPALGKPEKGDSLTLSPEAKAQVAKLQARDSEVKAHEQAHIGAGAGVVTSGASYTYQRGPDGRSYAVGGEVSVDSSPVKGNPQATIMKAMRIMAAALAPADPSGQDRSVAAAAASMAAQAAGETAKGQGTGEKPKANPYGEPDKDAKKTKGAVFDALG